MTCWADGSADVDVHTFRKGQTMSKPINYLAIYVPYANDESNLMVSMSPLCDDVCVYACVPVCVNQILSVSRNLSEAGPPPIRPIPDATMLLAVFKMPG